MKSLAVSGPRSLAQTVRALRVLRGIRRQADLAQLAGVSPRTIFSIERGERRPHRATLRAVADALAVPVEWLLDEAEIPARTSATEAHP